MLLAGGWRVWPWLDRGGECENLATRKIPDGRDGPSVLKKAEEETRLNRTSPRVVRYRSD